MAKSVRRERTAQQRLSELQSIYPLPRGCRLQDSLRQRVRVGELELSMIGLVASAPGRASVTGSAAARDGYPVDRAYFELLERASLFVARARGKPLQIRALDETPRNRVAPSAVFPTDPRPERARLSLSNGVALHTSWARACESAICELIERDRVLRSFAGEFAPVRMPPRDREIVRALRSHYTVEAYRFDPPDRTLTHTAAGVFLFPRDLTHPLAYGFAAARERGAALAAASGEAIQRLAFLWGEPLPDRTPQPSPAPDYHQEFYLYPPHQRSLRAWLSGTAHSRSHVERSRAASQIFDGSPASFVDLTPADLPQLRVVRAQSPRARALRFGAAALRGNTQPHPIA